MSKLGSQVNEFGSAMDRIKKRQELLKENAVRLEAMRRLKEIQAELTTINFFDVLTVMDPQNPLKKEVEAFETMLADLRKGVEEFVTNNQFDSVDQNIKDLKDAEEQENELENEDETEGKQNKTAVSGEKEKKDTDTEKTVDKNEE